MPVQHDGVVLTNVKNLDQLDDCVRRGGYNMVKVITGWGVDSGGWNEANRRQVLAMVPNVVVRTVTGDPSYQNKGRANLEIDPNQAVAEIRPWYALRQDILIELGNEPNDRPYTTNDIYVWAYTVGAAIARCRQEFPNAKIITPAVLLDGPNAEQFLRIGAESLRKAHFVAMHAYEWVGFSDAKLYPSRLGTYEMGVKWYSELFPHTPWYLSEYGIHDPKLSSGVKGARYAKFIHKDIDKRFVGACVYHLSMNGQIQPEYHMYPAGDITYHTAKYAP